MKKAIVTGGTGFIGVHLINELISNDVEVFAICRSDSDNLYRLNDISGVKIIECDLAGIKKLPYILQARNFDTFYHLAWQGASGKLRTDYQVQQNNASICCDMAAAAKELGCKKIVATGTVYEELCDSILCSDTFRTPSFYLLSKKYAHEMLLQLTLKLGIDFTWCTFFHPIGKYIKPEQMMSYTISCLLKGESPTFGKAQEPYDIVAVEDIAHGLMLAGERKLPKRQYYIGSGSPKRLHTYLEMAQALLNPNLPLGIGTRPDDGLRFNFDWFDCSEFQKDTGYVARVNFEDAIINTAEWINEMEKTK
jgi:nucleoside-diphosphate-sugar epimerase